MPGSLLGSYQRPVLNQDRSQASIPGGATVTLVGAVAPAEGTLLAFVVADVAVTAVLTAGAQSETIVATTSDVLTLSGVAPGDVVTLRATAVGGPAFVVSGGVTLIAQDQGPFANLLTANTWRGPQTFLGGIAGPFVTRAGGTTATVAANPFFNPKDYGAKGDAVTDDRAAIQACLDDAPADATIDFGDASNEYVIGVFDAGNSKYWGLRLDKDLTFRGEATLRVKAAGFPTNFGCHFLALAAVGVVLDLGGLTIDGNTNNLNLAGYISTRFLIGVSGGTAVVGQTCTIIADDVNFVNFNTIQAGAPAATGIGIDDYGCKVCSIGTVRSDNCDFTVWHTTLVPDGTGVCVLGFDRIEAANPSSGVLYIEEAGSVFGNVVTAWCDVPTAGRRAVSIQTGLIDISEVFIGTINARNMGALNIGVGGTAYLTRSAFGVVSMTGDPTVAGINITRCDVDVWFGAILADGTNAGSIVQTQGTTVARYPTIEHVAIGAPSAGASLNVTTPAVVKGGWVGGTIVLSGGAVMPPTSIRNVKGYNPQGLVVVAVPASTVAAAAAAVDRVFHITAGASTCAIALTNAAGAVQTVATIPNGGYGSVPVPAGSTITPTYAAAPTWTVQAL